MKKCITILLFLMLVVGCGSKKRKQMMTSSQSVSGRVSFYHPNQKKEVRVPLASVQAIISDTVVAQSYTDEQGNYILPIPDSVKHGLVTVHLNSISPVITTTIAVMKQTSDETYHEYFGPVVVGMSNVDFYLRGKNAAPFNILTQLIRGMLFVRDHAGDDAFPLLKARWQDEEDGKGFTYFVRRGSDYMISVTSTKDPDEFDDSVILHELGHYMLAVFSLDHSPGGEHVITCGTNQNLDPRLAYSEGWANAFAQIVRGDPVYQDYFTFNVEDICSAQFGPRSEIVVASVFWDLYDGNANGVPSEDNDFVSIPFQKIWLALKNVVGYNVTLWDFYDAVRRLDYVPASDWDRNFMGVGADEHMLIQANWEALISPVVVEEPVIHR